MSSIKWDIITEANVVKRKNVTINVVRKNVVKANIIINIVVLAAIKTFDISVIADMGVILGVDTVKTESITKK